MESLQTFAPYETEKLTLVTFFEDAAASHRAERMVARIIDGIDSDTIVVQQRWSFATVADSDAGVAGWLDDADVILVAGARGREIADAVAKVIVRELSPVVDHPTALVALGIVSSVDDSAPPALFSSLENISARLGARFFSTSARACADRA